MKTYTDFDIIEIVDESSSYPALLGIGWKNDHIAIINFKKRVMNYENHDMLFIAPLDPNQGWRCVEPMKDDSVGGWDNSYNIYK